MAEALLEEPIVEDSFNWRTPEYDNIFDIRMRRLEKLRGNLGDMAAIRAYYAEHPWDFIRDWGMTFDPRMATEPGALSTIPFIPFPRQVEFLQWVMTRWRERERGLVEKSRDMGITWLVVGFAVCQFCCRPGFVAGFGSRKGELVDKAGDDKSIFEKVRMFIQYLPQEFLPDGFDEKNNSAHMRVWNPVTQSALIGESGNNIGRGGRTSIYFVDEAAFIEDQGSVDRALSQNTNCQIDLSTVNGSGNEFYNKRMRFDNTPRIFVFDWRDDPRKDQGWYDRQCEEHPASTVAQEIDRDYFASQEDIFIPAEYVASCVDAHLVLGFEPEGLRKCGFDPSDVGEDPKAVVIGQGSVIEQAEQLKDADVVSGLDWAFRLADRARSDMLIYDGDGMGAPVMRERFQRRAADRMLVVPFHGGGEVDDPDEKYGATGDPAIDHDLRTNKDTFLNCRAQAWTWLYDRCALTHEMVQRARQNKLVNVNPEDLISFSSECKEINQLRAELSRPKRIYTKNGKIQVESKQQMRQRQVDSPNLADAAVMYLYGRRPPPKNTKRAIQLPRRMTDPGIGY